MSRTRDRLEPPPLFATESLIGTMLLGPEREREWRQIAPILEARGFPKVDLLMGGRYTRAIVNFFDREYGLARGDVPLAPDGMEHFDKWRTRKRHS